VHQRPGLDAEHGRHVRGDSNAEGLAAELDVSRKTVETHIRNLFGKLRVRSRHEVALVVERSA
jgi:DNA-binding NarL/FixJ family response regulator